MSALKAERTGGAWAKGRRKKLFPRRRRCGGHGVRANALAGKERGGWRPAAAALVDDVGDEGEKITERRG